MLRNFKLLPLQSYARSTKVANTEFDDYNTNIDGDKLGEIAIHLRQNPFRSTGFDKRYYNDFKNCIETSSNMTSVDKNSVISFN